MSEAIDTGPEPAAQPAASPTRRSDGLYSLRQLVSLLLELIAHGQELAARLQQGTTDASFARTVAIIGSSDRGIVMTCIRRGIMRATALYAVLSRHAERDPDATFPINLPFSSPPRAPGGRAAPATPRAPKWWEADDLAYLPTRQEVDDEIRHRPVQRILQEICLDLGIGPRSASALWCDLFCPIVYGRGRFIDLFGEILIRTGEVSPDLWRSRLKPSWRRAEPAPAAAAPPPTAPTPPPAPHTPRGDGACKTALPDTASGIPWPAMPPPAQVRAVTGPP